MFFQSIAVILCMIDFNYRPSSYFDGTGPTALVAKLSYPESQWGEILNLYATPVDGEIHFEMVDYYSNDYILQPSKSSEPLTLEEIIIMIETIEVSDKEAKGNVSITISGIPEAESWLYPQLKQYFQEKRKTFGMT